MISRRQAWRTQRSRIRKGAAAVECALVTPLLALLVLGAIDMGQCANLYQKVSDASRKGARKAARYECKATSEVQAAVMEYLKESSPGTSAETLASATVITVTNADGKAVPGDLKTVSSGSPIQVHVQVQFDHIRWMDFLKSLDGRQVSATTVMRRE